MTDVVKITDTGVLIGSVSEIAKLNVGGTLYLYNVIDDFAALIMRPNDGNKTTRIQVRGDNAIAHSAIVFKQVAPTGIGNPTDSRIEVQTMDGGVLTTRLIIDESGDVLGSTGKALAFRTLRALDANGLSLADDGNILGIFVKDGGQVGIANSNPVAALDVTGRVKIRGASTDTNWSEDGQLALKTSDSGDGFLGLTFHKQDGTRIGVISVSVSGMSIVAGEESFLHLIVNDILRLKIDPSGKVGIGGYDSFLARPILGQFHVLTDLFRTGYIFAESPTNAIGTTPVVLIDKEDPSGVGVNFVATGNVLIKSSDNAFAQGAFISVKNGSTQVVTLDGSNSITFEVVNNSCQLTCYRSAGTKVYFVSFMGMYT